MVTGCFGADAQCVKNLIASWAGHGVPPGWSDLLKQKLPLRKASDFYHLPRIGPELAPIPPWRGLLDSVFSRPVLRIPAKAGSESLLIT